MDTQIDVIVFECGDRRFAVELQHIQEVVTLGYITAVPLAPSAIEGATNVRGRMVPVISLLPFFGAAAHRTVLPGTPAILLAVRDRVAALPVQRVVDVVSLPQHRFERGGEGSGPLIPGCFRGAAGSIPLLDILGTLERIRQTSQEANQRLLERSEVR